MHVLCGSNALGNHMPVEEMNEPLAVLGVAFGMGHKDYCGSLLVKLRGEAHDFLPVAGIKIPGLFQ